MTDAPKSLKLHWSPRSPFVRKVMVAAHELGVADRLALVRTLVGINVVNEDILPDNPLNRIPTLVTPEGRKYYDSVVVCEYLDLMTGGGRLFPTDPKERLEALRWHALGSGFIEVLIIFNGERNRPPELRSQPHLDAYARKTAATLDTLEREIGDLPTDRFGIEHIAIGCAMGHYDFRFGADDWRARLPKLAAWQKAFDARPSAIATKQQEG